MTHEQTIELVNQLSRGEVTTIATPKPRPTLDERLRVSAVARWHLTLRGSIKPSPPPKPDGHKYTLMTPEERRGYT